MALFSKELNLLAHRIRRIAQDLTWGEAFRQAIELSKARVPAKPLLEDTWSQTTLRALAGHFWALRCLYREAGDEGRSIAFERVSNSLFACWDERGDFDLALALRHRRFGKSVIAEIVDFYICAQTGDEYYTDHTDRVMNLLTLTNNPHNRVYLPVWK